MKRLLRVFFKSKHPGMRLLRLLGGVWLGLLAVLMIFEEKLIFFPSRYPDGDWNTTPRVELREGRRVSKIEDVSLTSADGVRLHAWFCSPQVVTSGKPVDVPAQQVLLFLHGNAGNLSYRRDMVERLLTLPVKVLLLDYRGYGKSEGSPDEQGLYQDARGAWDYLVHERGIRPEDVIILGKSLGGGVATELANHVQAGGLIVQASFTSVPDMAKGIYPFVPKFLIRTQMNSLAKIARVAYPVLIVHGTADEVIPFAMGEQLYAAASEPKRFHKIPGAGHNDDYYVGGRAYLEAVRGFLAFCLSASQPPADSK